MALQLNLEDVFDPAELGVAASWSGGGTINGVFLRPYAGATVGDVEIEGYAPTFLCSERDASNVLRPFQKGKTLFIDGITYRIINVQPSGLGVAYLVLQQAV